MKRHTTIIAIAVFGLAAAISVPAQAVPIFRIGEGGTPWNVALGSNVQGISAQETANTTADFLFQSVQNQGGTSYAQSSYGPGGQYQLTPVNPVEDENDEQHDALVMSWGPPPTVAGTDMELSAAGWEYVYDVDPDLTGLLIEFSVYPPPGIWDIIIALEDAAGRKRKWLDFGPPNAWGDVILDPSILGPQGNFDLFMEDAGFDLTMVTEIELYEAGNLVGIVDPSGANFGVWNAWNHLRVFQPVPEPGIATLLALGAGGLLIRLRRRDAR